MDAGTWTVTIITLVLFVAALFTKGITHDFFLEAGIFLVSVKIILMAYKNSVSVKRMETKLEKILDAVTKQDHPGHTERP